MTRYRSFQGVQYASCEYVDTLEDVGARISMASVGNPYENAKAESFFRNLKMEEVYVKDYRSFEEAQHNIGEFIEEVYNKKRLHSSVRTGYKALHRSDRHRTLPQDVGVSDRYAEDSLRSGPTASDMSRPAPLGGGNARIVSSRTLDTICCRQLDFRQGCRCANEKALLPFPRHEPLSSTDCSRTV